LNYTNVKLMSQSSFKELMSDLTDIAPRYEGWDALEFELQSDFMKRFCLLKPGYFFDLLTQGNDNVLFRLLDFMVASEHFHKDGFDAASLDMSMQLANELYDVFNSYPLIGGKLTCADDDRIGRMQQIFSFYANDSALCWEAISEYPGVDGLMFNLVCFMLHESGLNNLSKTDREKVYIMQVELYNIFSTSISNYIDDALQSVFDYKGRIDAANDAKYMNQQHFATRV